MIHWNSPSEFPIVEGYGNVSFNMLIRLKGNVVVTGYYNMDSRQWVSVATGKALKSDDILGWIDLFLLENNRNWTSFTQQVPPKNSVIVVWDTRINEPKKVKVSSSLGLVEENGRYYDGLMNRYYSHWSFIEPLNEGEKAEMEEWIKNKGIRLGIDK